MSGADLQQLQQMAQQAQMPPMQRQQQPPMMPQMQQMPQMQPQFDLSQAIMAMQRQPMQQVQNPIFGGAIPMNFGLPQASQIPADFAVRQFTPGVFDQVKKTNNINNSNRFYDPYYNYNYGEGDGSGSAGDDGNASADGMGGEDV